MPAVLKKCFAWSPDAEKLLGRARRTLLRLGVFARDKATNAAVVRHGLLLAGAATKVPAEGLPLLAPQAAPPADAYAWLAGEIVGQLEAQFAMAKGPETVGFECRTCSARFSAFSLRDGAGIELLQALVLHGRGHAPPRSKAAPTTAPSSPPAPPAPAQAHRVAWELPDGERIALTCIAHNPNWRPLTTVERTVCKRLRDKGFLDAEHALTFLGRRVAEARVGWLSVANVEGMRERLRPVLREGARTLDELFAHPDLESGGSECITVALRLLHDAGETMVKKGMFMLVPASAPKRPPRRSTMRR
jgi:hypothetical protein